MKKILLIITIILIFVCRVHSIDTLNIGSEPYYFNFLDYIYILEDKNNVFNINDIQENSQEFTGNSKRDLNFGNTKSAIWLKFSLKNVSDLNKKFVLGIRNPDLNNIEYYELKGNELKKIITGEKRSLNSRDIRHRNFLFEIELKPQQSSEYYIKVDSEGESNYIPITLQDRRQFLISDEKENAIEWLVFGLLLFVVIFNFYLYRSIKGKIYLNYALYILFGMLFFMIFDGYHAFLDMPKVFLKFKIITPSLFVYFLLNFSQIFLESEKRWKRINKVVNGLKIGAIIMTIFYFFDYPISTISIIGLLIISTVAFLLITTGSVVASSRNNMPNVYFSIAFFSMITGVMVFQLKEFGIFPANFIMENSIRLGTTTEAILLTIAVLERFKLQQETAQKTIQENYQQISKQNLQLERVNDELEKLSIVARETDNSVAIYDCNFKIEWCNLGFEKLHETTLKEIKESKRHKLRNIYPERFRELIDNIHSNYSIQFENKLVTKSGGEVWLQTTLSTYKDGDGSILKVIAIDSNITQLKEYQKELTYAKEKAEESDRLKSAFLSNMSHEIRTPLNAILGFSDLLKEDVDIEKRKKFITLIRSNGFHLLHIISDLLDISKIESGQMIANNTKESLNRNLQKIYEYYKTDKSILNRNINLKCQCLAEDFSDFVITDHSKIRQVLDNLLNNAIKFTEKGEIVFGVTAIDNKLHFYVRDTGIGISPEHKSRVFERFWQGELGLSRKYEGTGLGLSISHGIIQCLDGEIWVESEQDVGSAFYFEIPYYPVDKSNMNSKGEEGLDLTGKKILVVEDKKDSALLLDEMLQGKGAELIFVENGKEAVNIAVNTDIDLVLMDLRLPDYNGTQAVKLIREYKLHLPIIAQTANASDDERQICLKSGFFDYLTKPIDKSLLFSCLGSINWPKKMEKTKKT